MTPPRSPDAGRPLRDALRHPLRRQALSYLQEHGTGSASEIARALDLPVNSLSYHIRRLARLGLIEEVRRIRSRGALMRVFRTTDRFRTATVALLGDEIARLASVTHPELEPGSMALLDPQALDELAREMKRVFARVGELQAQTEARAVQSASPQPITATAVLFAITAASTAVDPKAGGRPARG